jgi:hypothetical protein
MRLTRGVLLIATVFMVVGCATFKVNQAAFAKPRTLALVTVSGAVSGLATSNAEDIELLKQTVVVSFNELNRSRHIKLAREKAVLSSKAYKAIKDNGPAMMTDLAPGYKRFSIEDEKANLLALSKELKVDGFLIVTVAYGRAQSSFGIGGILPVPIPVTAGSARASVVYYLNAFDVNGDELWQDQIKMESEESVTTVMGVGRYGALHSKLIDLGKAASRQAVQNLQERL